MFGLIEGASSKPPVTMSTIQVKAFETLGTEEEAEPITLAAVGTVSQPPLCKCYSRLRRSICAAGICLSSTARSVWTCYLSVQVACIWLISPDLRVVLGEERLLLQRLQLA